MTYRGGRVPDPSENDAGRPLQQLRRHACFAQGCPMAGSIFESIGPTDRPGSCVWHYGVAPNDLPKVTNVLTAWLCVSMEVQNARRVLTGDSACDAAAQNIAFREAWQRLRPQVMAFENELEPWHAEDFGDWAQRLDAFLGGQVRDCLTQRTGRPR